MSEITADKELAARAASKTRKAERRTHGERTEMSDRLMLDAARDLILELGTQGTTLKQIGERAGYSRGLAHARFGSKDGLFVKLQDRCRDQWLSELAEAAIGKSGVDALISRLEAIESFANKHPRECRVMYILWFESVGTQSPINSSLARFHRAARADIQNLVLAAGLFDDDGEAERYATRFCGTLFGLCYQWLVAHDAIRIEDHLQDMRRQIKSDLQRRV